jgi:hypothetical protein
MRDGDPVSQGRELNSKMSLVDQHGDEVQEPRSQAVGAGYVVEPDVARETDGAAIDLKAGRVGQPGPDIRSLS